MPSPDQCRFTDSHEWFAVDGDHVIIGITQFAANELTDITYVETRDVGSTIAPGETVGEVESVKTTSDVYSVIGGEIVETNQDVQDDPSLINSDPMGKGWLVKLRASDLGPLEELMDNAAYDAKHPVG